MNRRRFVKRASLALAGLGYTASTVPLFGSLEEPDSDRKPSAKRRWRHDHPDYQKTGVRMIEPSCPQVDGFRFPAEWEPHQSTLMAFPPPQNWTGFPMVDVRRQWAKVANAIAEFEPVLMVVRPEDKRLARDLLHPTVELMECPLNDGWARDTGPMFVVNVQGEKRVAACTFNGWGDKFDGVHQEDALLKARVCKKMDVPLYPIDLVLEGGSVHFDGEGTLLTTEECLCNKNRNPDLSKTAIETELHRAFGTSQVIWLEKGLTPDPITDGHIDGMAAFVKPGVVLVHTTQHKSDPNFEICAAAKRCLEQSTDAKKRKLEIVDLPLTENGNHMNFYIGNGFVLVPTVGVEAEGGCPIFC